MLYKYPSSSNLDLTINSHEYICAVVENVVEKVVENENNQCPRSKKKIEEASKEFSGAHILNWEMAINMNSESQAEVWKTKKRREPLVALHRNLERTLTSKDC